MLDSAVLCRKQQDAWFWLRSIVFFNSEMDEKPVSAIWLIGQAQPELLDNVL